MIVSIIDAQAVCSNTTSYAFLEVSDSRAPLSNAPDKHQSDSPIVDFAAIKKAANGAISKITLITFSFISQLNKGVPHHG